MSEPRCKAVISHGIKSLSVYDIHWVVSWASMPYHSQYFEQDYFDVVISNPPFHFEHENNIEVSLSLFQQVFNKLKPNGRFQLVANSHLNYRTHLLKIFPEVISTAENEKFVVYECIKD